MNTNKVDHICCVAGYYDRNDPTQDVARVSLIITRLADDKIVDRHVFGAITPDDKSYNAALDGILAKYPNVALVPLSEPVPLDYCTCGCKDPLDRMLTRVDWERMQEDRKQVN